MLFATTMNNHSEKHWGIVGGGVLGLRLAQRLSGAGQRVTVLESAPQIGGLAGAWSLPVEGDAAVVWDKYYHVTLLSDLRLRGLLDELGLADRVRWVETKTGFLTDGRLHSMSNSIEFLRFPPLGLIDKLRLAATIFYASKITDPTPLEQVPVGDWLRKWSGRRTFEKIWEPLLLAKLGEAHRRCSAAFIWATIARMYRARQSGMKKEMFGYVAGGYAAVLPRYAELLRGRGVRIETGARCERVAAQDGRVEVATDRGDHRFDRVVLTTPSGVTERLCPQLSDDERARHRGVEYLGVVCASMLLDRPLSPYYVTNITDRGAPFTAVIEMTAMVNPSELGGRRLVYLPRYAAPDDEAWRWSDDEVRERFVAAVEERYADFDRSRVGAFRVARAPHVMALPTIDYPRRLPPMRCAPPGVFAINGAHITKGTLNVNEVLELADTAFETHLRPETESRAARAPAAV